MVNDVYLLIYKVSVTIIFCFLYISHVERYIGSFADIGLDYGFHVFYKYYLFFVLIGFSFYIILFSSKFKDSFFVFIAPFSKYIYIGVTEVLWDEGYYFFGAIIFSMQAFFLVIGAFAAWFMVSRFGHPVSWIARKR